MSPLNRKLLRDLVSHKAQVAAITIVVALGIIMFAGPLMAQRDLRDSVEDIYRRTGYEDFSLQLESAPLEAVQMVAEIDGVAAAEGRLSQDTLVEVGGRRLTVRMVSVPDEGGSGVNGLIVQDGRPLEPGERGAFMAEHHLAGEFKLVPGDTLTLFTPSGAETLRMVGTVVSPEYIRLVRSRSEYVTDPAAFGVAFIAYSEAAGLSGMEGRVTEIVARVEDDAGLEGVMAEAGHRLSPYGVIGLIAGRDRPGALALSSEISDIGRLALFFSILLLGVASLGVYITMTQIVFAQQREIGVTRALGYGRRTITAHYLGYGIVIGAAGGLTGVGFAYLLSVMFVRIYAGIFDLPLISTSLNGTITAAGVAVGAAFSVAGSVIPARHAVRMKPAEAMRTEVGLAPAATIRERTRGSALKGLPVWVRTAWRNLRRNRRRTVLTWLGVVATLCLMVTASGGRDSLDYAVEKYLEGVLRWDLAAGWTEPVDEHMLERVLSINGVEAAEPFIDAPARLSAGENSVDVQVQAYVDGTVMHGWYPTRGSSGRPGPGQVVLNRGVTDRLPVRVGGSVTVHTAAGSLPLEVAGFVAEPFGGVCYVNYEFIQEILERFTGLGGGFNAVVVRAATGSEDEVAEELLELPGVAQVLTRGRILSVFEELVAAIRTIFYIFYLMAFAMGFSILFSMTSVSLFERRREIATMRTLGAGRGRVFSLLSLETAALVLAALVPGILLGRFMEWVVIEKVLSSERLVPDAVISGSTIGFIVFASLAVMVISQLPSMRSMWRMDLARMTKERAD